MKYCGASIPEDRHKTILDIMLITGMRYAEILRLYENKAWYNEKRNIIHLNNEAQLKHKRRQLERTIHPLPSMFNYILKDFWEGAKPPLEATWNKNMQRWAIGAGIKPYGLSVKTTKKNNRVMVYCFRYNRVYSLLKTRTRLLTSMRHYQGLAFF